MEDLQKLVQNGRIPVKHEGRTIYEWDQTIEDVNIYFKPPDTCKSKHDFVVKIQPTHVIVGLKGNPPFIDEDLAGTISASESFWMLEDGELHLQLTKMRKAETWPGVFKNHGEMNPFMKDEAQKKILLERFQEENPGFDFSGATFSGSAPDPRTFMGGVKYK